MAIVPDTKNWTWVLETRCPDCGFDAAAVDVARMADLLSANVAEWTALLADAQARTRPDDETWSTLEYGCHVRDVFIVFDERLRRMLEEDGPQFENWDQDAAAVEQRYDLQDPAIVAAELVTAGRACADRWNTVAESDWPRTGDRSDGSSFTIETFARYLMHDPVHHLADVRRGSAQLRLADS